MGKFDLAKTTLGQLMDDPEALAVLQKHVGDMLKNPMIGMAKGMPFNSILAMVGGQVQPEVVESIKSELEAIE